MEGQPDRARLRLRRIPSNYTLSFMTGTNSTMSGIRGPGRLVGDLIRSGGRRLEDGLGRAATRLGYGPNAAVWRFLNGIAEGHAHSRCGAEVNLTGLEPSFPVLLEAIQRMQSSCALCRLHLIAEHESDRLQHSGLRASFAATTLFAPLLRYLQMGDCASKLLSVRYLHAFAATNWIYRDILFCDWDGISVLRDLSAQCDTRVLEGHSEWESLMLPARQTLVLLEEDPEPNMLAWYFLHVLGDIHDRRNCKAKLSIQSLDASLDVVLETIQTLTGYCASCYVWYYSLASMGVINTLVTRVVLSLKTGNFDARLVSAQYICAFIAAEPGLGYHFRSAEAIPALNAALKRARNHVSEGHVQWEAVIDPTKQALALLEQSEREDREYMTLGNFIDD